MKGLVLFTLTLYCLSGAAFGQQAKIVKPKREFTEPKYLHDLIQNLAKPDDFDVKHSDYCSFLEAQATVNKRYIESDAYIELAVDQTIPYAGEDFRVEVTYSIKYWIMPGFGVIAIPQSVCADDMTSMVTKTGTLVLEYKQDVASSIIHLEKIPRAHRILMDVTAISFTRLSDGSPITTSPQNVRIRPYIESRNTTPLYVNALGDPVPSFTNTSGHIVADYQFNAPVYKPETNSLSVSWYTFNRFLGSISSVVVTPTAFELEWTWVDNYDYAYSESLGHDVISEIDIAETSVNFSSATRITTEGMSFDIPLLYERGYLLYRVRAIGVQANDPTLTRVYTGNWSSLRYIQDGESTTFLSNYLDRYKLETGHEPGVNWQSSVTFAEEGKNKPVIIYFDGSLRKRQSATRNNAETLSIFGETKYDYEGRPVVEILPTPVFDDQGAYTASLDYQSLLNTPSGISQRAFGRQEFDQSSDDENTCNVTSITGIGTVSGAGQYYSEANPDKASFQAYLPDAEGFPFTQVEYMPDNSGRISRQGGVGPNHQLGSGHETKYYYDTPTQQELDRLFGVEVGDASHYMKVTSVDPNGTISIAYQDMHGRTIATSVLNPAPAALLPINHALAPAPVVDQLEDDNSLIENGTALEVLKTIVVPTPRAYQIAYTLLSQQQLDRLCGYCHTCTYQVEVSLTDQCGKEWLTAASLQNSFVADGCVTGNSTPLTLQETFPLLPEGTYTLRKTLRVDQTVARQAEEDYLTHLRNLETNPDPTNDCIRSYTDILSEELAKVEALTDPCEQSCDGCIERLGTQEAFVQLGINNILASEPEADQATLDAVRLTTIQEYQNLVEACSLKCVPQGKCDLAYRLMLEDITPREVTVRTVVQDGTEYYIELEDGIRIPANPNRPYAGGSQYASYTFGTTPDDAGCLVVGYGLLSATGISGRTWRSPVDFYRNVDGSISTELYGGVASPASPEVADYICLDDFVRLWKDSWAETLVKLHPEYCYYEFCNANLTAEGYEQKLRDTDTYTEAVSEGLITGADFTHSVPQSEFELILNNDPYFNQGIGQSQKNTMKAALLHADDIPASEGWNMYQLAAFMASCNSLPTNAQIYPCFQHPANQFGSALSANRDNMWQVFRGLYIDKRTQLYNQQRAAAGCSVTLPAGSQARFPDTEASLTTPSIGAVTGATTEAELISEANNLTNEQRAKVLEFCDDACRNNANTWLQSLEDCKMQIYTDPASGYTNNRSGFDTYWNTNVAPELLEGLTKVCSAGCDLNNPMGTSVVPAGKPAVDNPYTDGQDGRRAEVESYRSFEEVIQHVLAVHFPSVSPSVACSHLFIDYPREPDFDLFELDAPVARADDCACDKLKDTYDDYVADLATSGKTPFSEDAPPFQAYFNTRYQLTGTDALSNQQIDELFCWCNNRPSTPTPPCSTDNHILDLRAEYHESLRSDICFAPASMVYEGGQALSFWFKPDLTYLSNIVANKAPGDMSEDILPMVSYAQTPSMPSTDEDAWWSAYLKYSPGRNGVGRWTVGFESAPVTCNNGEYLSLPATSQPLSFSTVDTDNWFHVIIGGGNSITRDAAAITVIRIDQPFEEPQQPFSLINADCSGAAERFRDDFQYNQILLGDNPELKDGAVGNRHLYSGRLENVAHYQGFIDQDWNYIHNNGPNPCLPRQEEQGVLWKMDFEGTPLCLIEDNCGWGYTDTEQLYSAQGAGIKSTVYSHNFFECTGFRSDSQERVTGNIHLNSFPLFNPVDNTWRIRQQSSPNTEGPAEVQLLVTPRVPRTFTCPQVCATCQQVQALVNTFQNSAPYNTTAYWRGYALDGNGQMDKTSPKYKEVQERWLNRQLHYRLSFVDYDEFLATCRTNLRANLCDKPLLPTITIGDDPQTPCVQYLRIEAEAEAKRRYLEQFELLDRDFNYNQRCLSITKEAFSTEATFAEEQYTLYYYDQAGNLVQTVPPQGVSVLDQTTADFAKLQRWRQWRKCVQDGGANCAGIQQPGDAFSLSTPPIQLLPAHTLLTAYTYNTLNSVTSHTSPDIKDAHRIWYDEVGRAVLSQNAKQRNKGSANQTGQDFGYTLYDALNRIIEAGEVNMTTPVGSGPGLPFDPKASYLQYSRVEYLVSATLANPRKDVLQSYYNTTPAAIAQQLPTDFVSSRSEDLLRNRIATITYTEVVSPSNPLAYSHATHFSYDIHGNVGLLLQDYPEMAGLRPSGEDRFKRTLYTYDLISGNVHQVAYQPGQADQYYHRYTYDLDNRLKEALTSTDGQIWQRDAGYLYYKHGPLARTELGEYEVQGLDYLYTIHGWIKGVNSERISPEADPGHDGLPGSDNETFALDVAGYSLGYYRDDSQDIADYKAIDRNGDDHVPPQAVPLPEFYTNTQTGNHSLYNGNITWMVTGLFNHLPPQATAYRYDNLNRLRSMRVFADDGIATYSDYLTDPTKRTTWATTGTQTLKYNTSYTYDRNGNIQRLNRNGHKNVGDPMDRLTYFYIPGTNQLDHVEDAVTDAAAYDTDLETQNAGNYTYDRIGQLTKDEQEGIASIEWNLQNKPTRVTKTDGSQLIFAYGSDGNRVKKEHHVPAATPGPINTTYYVRDAQGNVLSVYTKETPVGPPPAQPTTSLTPEQMQDALIAQVVSRYGATGAYQALVQPFEQTICISGATPTPGSIPPAACSPPQPTIVRTVGGVTLSWPTVPGALYYEVGYYINSPNSPANLRTLRVYAPSHSIIIGGSYGTWASWPFTVRAWCSGAYTPQGTATLPQQPDGTATTLLCSSPLVPQYNAPGSTTLSTWWANAPGPGQKRYQLEYRPADDPTAPARSLEQNTTSAYLTGLRPATTYIMRLRAYCSGAWQSWGGYVTFTTATTPGFAIYATAATATSLSLGWQSVPPGTTQLLLLLDAPGNADPFVVLNMPAPSAYVFTGLSPSTNYSAVIRPVSTLAPAGGWQSWHVWQSGSLQINNLRTPAATDQPPTAESPLVAAACNARLGSLYAALLQPDYRSFSLLMDTWVGATPFGQYLTGAVAADEPNLNFDREDDYPTREVGGSATQRELHQYGRSRLGIHEVNRVLKAKTNELWNPWSNEWMDPVSGSVIPNVSEETFTFVISEKRYEIANHLGNVLATVTDRKTAIMNGGTLLHWQAEVLSTSDYYPFGMTMEGRQVESDKYRYGFNGKEKDTEWSGGKNIYDYGFRIYNPALGKFLSVDPLTQNYVHFTPYQFASNKPISHIDIDGCEGLFYEEFAKLWESVWYDYGGSTVMKPAAEVVLYLNRAFIVNKVEKLWIVFEGTDFDGQTYSEAERQIAGLELVLEWSRFATENSPDPNTSKRPPNAPVDKGTEAVKNLDSPIIAKPRNTYNGRPHWRQSELDVQNANIGKGYRPQVSFKNQKEVPYGTDGSARPELWHPEKKIAIEVKNYDLLKNEPGLLQRTAEQVNYRFDNLPPGSKQHVVIDARGQNLTQEQTDDIVLKLRERFEPRVRETVSFEVLR